MFNRDLRLAKLEHEVKSITKDILETERELELVKTNTETLILSKRLNELYKKKAKANRYRVSYAREINGGKV